MKDARAGKWLEGLKKYRLAALAALLGIVLMLLPGGNAEAEPTAGSQDAEAFDRGAVQEEMENILRAIDFKVENGVITAIGPAGVPCDVDAQGKYLVPEAQE